MKQKLNLHSHNHNNQKPLTSKTSHGMRILFKRPKIISSVIQTSTPTIISTISPVDRHLPSKGLKSSPVQLTRGKSQQPQQSMTQCVPNGRIGIPTTCWRSPLTKRPGNDSVTKHRPQSPSIEDGVSNGARQCKKPAVCVINSTTLSNIAKHANPETRQPPLTPRNTLTTWLSMHKNATTKDYSSGIMSNRPCSDYIRRNEEPDLTYPSDAISTTSKSKRRYHSQNIKNTLADIMNNYDIFCNERYNHVLSTNVNLQKLELLFNPLQLNHLKSQLFNQIRIQRDNKTWIDRVDLVTSMEDKFKYLALKLLLSIANENNMELANLAWLIVSVLNSEFHKKKTIVFHGLTNSGKTTFSEMLLSPFYPYEIGCFSSPASQGQNNFWLMALIGKSVYRSEELIMENYQCLQQFKMLAEGNQLLETEVKYQTNQKLPSKPVIVTTNAESPERFCLFFSDECQAVKNRTIWIKMSRHLYTRIPEANLIYIPQITALLPTILIHFYNEYKNNITVNNNDVYIEEDILNLM